MGKYGRLALYALLLALAPDLALAEDGGEGLALLGAGIGAGLAMGLAGLGCGIGQGLTAGNTTAAIARNPEAAPTMRLNFILAMVLIESIAIYGFVLGIIIL